MLQAKLKNGKLLTLASLTKQEIGKVKQDEFFCPTCNERVFVKAGLKTVPHFAHHSKLECASNDGEGDYHAKGKLLLYNWLKNQGIDVEIEKYIPEISQRPDLFLTFRNRRIVIEYQCARIPINDLNQRNKGYLKAGITPIWILGAKHFHRLREHHFKVDQFILSFLHRFAPDFPLTLYFFCPQTSQFIIIQHIHLISSRHAIGLFNFASLKGMAFSKLFSRYKFHDRWLYQLWKKEKENFRLRQSNRLYGSELTWHKWVYEKGTHKEKLPSVVYLPVNGQYQMKTPLYNWQSRLCLELLNPLPIGATFTIQKCYHILRFHPQDHFSLITGTESPIYQYLTLLKKLQLIEEVDFHIFKKIKEIRFHRYVEDAVREDACLMNQLIHCSTME